MRTNDFVPTRLQIIPDGTLYRTLFEYRYALQILKSNSMNPSAETNQNKLNRMIQRVETQVYEAIQTIEGEMRARGLEC